MTGLQHLAMSKSKQIQKAFLEASARRDIQNKFLTDDAWIKIMKDMFNLTVTKQLLNMALANLQLLHPLQLVLVTRRNISGNRKTSFYFIANESCDKQLYLNPKKSWQEIYNDVRIPRKRPRLDYTTSECDERRVGMC